jgi:hypothetical protein
MDQYGQVKHDNKVLSQFRTTIEEGDVVVSMIFIKMKINFEFSVSRSFSINTRFDEYY